MARCSRCFVVCACVTSIIAVIVLWCECMSPPVTMASLAIAIDGLKRCCEFTHVQTIIVTTYAEINKAVLLHSRDHNVFATCADTLSS